MSDTRRSRQVTITQVAEQAGVSRGTVSNVLNDKDGVHPVLREKVLSAAQQLDYHPHPLAQGLRSGRTRIIGVCVPYITSPTLAAIVEGASDQAYMMGYAVIMSVTGRDSARRLAHLESLSRQRVAAVVVVPGAADGPEPYLQLQDSGIPVIFGLSRPAGVRADLVATQDRQGTMAAVRHLTGTGRRRVALLNASLSIESNVERMAGFHAALQGLGLLPMEDLICSGLGSRQEAYTATKALLGRAEPPDAIVAGGATITVGAMACLRDAGVKMPDEIAFVGTGDLEWARLMEPPLTMLEMDGNEIGRCAVRTAVARLRQTPQFVDVRDTLMPLRLVIRTSSASGEPGRNTHVESSWVKDGTSPQMAN